MDLPRAVRAGASCKLAKLRPHQRMRPIVITRDMAANVGGHFVIGRRTFSLGNDIVMKVGACVLQHTI